MNINVSKLFLLYALNLAHPAYRLSQTAMAAEYRVRGPERLALIEAARQFLLVGKAQVG